jgi:hypothetical protein
MAIVHNICGAQDVIDTFAENAPSLGHAESVSPCLKPLEI